MDILRELLEENPISILATTFFWAGYYVSSKLLQSSRNDLDHFTFAPRITDFNKLSSHWESDYPYAIVEGEVHPNSNSTAINSLYDPFTKGVVRNLKTWKLKKVWNIVTRSWDMGSSLQASFESDVPMHLTDPNHSKIYIQNFSEAKRHNLLQQVSNFTESVDDPMMKRILDNILQDEVVVGYKRVENMLKVGTKVLFCGKLCRELDGLKYVFRISKPQPPFTFSCTSLSYNEFLAVKTRNVSLLRFLTKLFGVVTAALVFYLIIQYIRSLWEKRMQRIEADQFRGDLLTYEITEQNYTQDNTPAGPGSITCSICYERPVRLLVKNCNHACLCLSCAPKVNGLCPICRAPVSKFEKIYFP